MELLIISITLNVTLLALIVIQWLTIKQLKTDVNISNYYKELYQNLWRSVTGRPPLNDNYN